MKDGSKYTGNWLDNNQDSQGNYVCPDGSKEVGDFKNGLLNGNDSQYNADGRNKERVFLKIMKFSMLKLEKWKNHLN